MLVGGILLTHLQNLPCNAHEVAEIEIPAASVKDSSQNEIGTGTVSWRWEDLDLNSVFPFLFLSPLLEHDSCLGWAAGWVDLPFVFTSGLSWLLATLITSFFVQSVWVDCLLHS